MNRTSLTLGLLLLIGSTGCASLPKMPLPAIGKRSAETTERMLSMARLMERHGKYEEAGKLYQQVLEKDPKQTLAYHRLGSLAVRRGEHDVALDYFERARKRGKPSAELLNDIGYTQYLKHDLIAAEETLREALRANPSFSSAHNNLGLVLAEQCRDEEAVAEFRKSGSEAQALSNLAYIQTKLGRLAEAEKNYHRALELDPKQKPAAEALIQFHAAREKAHALVAKLEQEAASADGAVTIVEAEPAAPPAHRPAASAAAPQPRSMAAQVASPPERFRHPLAIAGDDEAADDGAELTMAAAVEEASETVAPARFAWAESESPQPPPAPKAWKPARAKTALSDPPAEAEEAEAVEVTPPQKAGLVRFGR